MWKVTLNIFTTQLFQSKTSPTLSGFMQPPVMQLTSSVSGSATDPPDQTVLPGDTDTRLHRWQAESFCTEGGKLPAQSQKSWHESLSMTREKEEGAAGHTTSLISRKWLLLETWKAPCMLMMQSRRNCHKSWKQIHITGHIASGQPALDTVDR